MLELGFMHVADVNGDGRNDVVAGAGHNYGVFWFEQGEAGHFHFIPKAALNSPAEPVQVPAGVIGPAIQFVRCHSPYESLIAAVLDRVYVVETLEKAIAICDDQAEARSSKSGRFIAAIPVCAACSRAALSSRAA